MAMNTQTESRRRTFVRREVKFVCSIKQQIKNGVAIMQLRTIAKTLLFCINRIIKICFMRSGSFYPPGLLAVTHE